MTRVQLHPEWLYESPSGSGRGYRVETRPFVHMEGCRGPPIQLSEGIALDNGRQNHRSGGIPTWVLRRGYLAGPEVMKNTHHRFEFLAINSRSLYHLLTLLTLEKVAFHKQT